MATSWPSQTTANYAADKAVRLERAQALRDRDLCLMRRPFFVNIAEQSATDTTATALVEFDVWVPDYASGYKLAGIIDAKIDANSGTWYLRDKTSTNTGSNIDVSVTAYAESGPSELTIDASWVESIRTVEVVGLVANATDTMNLKATDIAAFYWTD